MSSDENTEPVETGEEELETEEVSEALVEEEPKVEEEKAKKTKEVEEEGEVAEEEAEKEEAPKEKGAKKERKKKEEKAKEGKEEEEEGEKVVEEKVVTINLRHAYLTYGRKAAPKAVRLVRKVAKKIFKTEDVKIDNSLNAILWSRGKTKTERKVSVKIQKLEDETVRVLPAGA
ncbi:MAG: hypothetical protein FJZ49_06030 [Candidatus Verstraetearchaeota archaeon]|nr:hypothetical protein [Candidatus Verstraetearchaeota archaeon]